MASYLMVKYSNKTYSVAGKTVAPSAPYIKIKNDYFPLTTDTSGTGVFVKNNNKTYKIVQTFTTSTSSSSTYNSYYQTTSTSYYTSTTGTNYASIASFTLSSRGSIRWDYIEDKYGGDPYFEGLSATVVYSAVINQSTDLRLKFKNKTITTSRTQTQIIFKDLYCYASEFTRYVKDNANIVDIVCPNLNSYPLYAGLLYSVKAVGTTVISAPYYCSVTSVKIQTASDYLINDRFSSLYRGALVSSSPLTQQLTRPSNWYQTYSKATSYYSVSTTTDKYEFVIFDGTSLKVGYKCYASNFGNPDTATGPCASPPTLSISGGVLSCTYDFSSGSTYWKLGGIVLDPVDLTGYSKFEVKCNNSSRTSGQYYPSAYLLDASKDVLTSRTSFMGTEGILQKATTYTFDISNYNYRAYIILSGQGPSGSLTSNITSIKLLV